MRLQAIFARLLGRQTATAPAAPAPAHNDLLASLLVMAWMVEARDPYTGGHLWRVSRYAELLAEALGWPPADAARAAIGGFLHDLGKIGIPDAILTKRGRLDDDEYAVIRTHPDIGMRLLAGHPLADLVRDAVRSHHEQPDGKGYPQRLTGPSIPADARLIGICDAFDAMTSTRPYRTGMAIDKALGIIRENLGTQFDKSFGTAFLSLEGSGVLEHVAGHSDDGIPLQVCMICGPTLVLTRENHPGDYVYCRSCGGEYVVRADVGQSAAVEATGRKGDAAEREPQADLALIKRIVHDAASRVSLEQLLAGAPRTHPG